MSRRCAIGLVLLIGAGCATAEPVPDPPASERALDAAAVAYERGNLTQAIALYSTALRDARREDDAQRIATGAYNLAACLLVRDRVAEAVPLLREAEREQARLERPVSSARLLRAEALRRLDDFDGAQRLTGAVLDDAAAAAAARAHAHLVRGRVAIDRGDLALARVELAATRIDPALADADPGLAARILQLEGAIAERDARPLEAAKSFDAEARLLAESGQYAGMAHATGRAGRAWLAAGHPGLAADRLYRAARTFAARDEPLAALRLIEPALIAAVDAGDEELARDVRLLLERIERRGD